MTHTFGSITGQGKPVSFLTALLQKGTIPNALLFTGPEGVGKRTAAFTFAMAANCSGSGTGSRSTENRGGSAACMEPCGVCRSCGKFESGNHPDLIRVDASGQFTRISQIRELRQILSMKPFEARLRVVIIGEARTMNAEAGNALLKVLEEPPDRTLLILVAPQKSDLLPTIVSRCLHIRFHPIPGHVLADALVRNHLMDKEDARVLAALANGSYSKALELKETDWIVHRNWLIDEAVAMDSNPVSALLAFAEKLAREKEYAMEALEIIKTWYRDLIVAKYRTDGILHADLSEKVREVSPRHSETELINRIKAVQHAQRTLDSNANPRLALENLVLRLAEWNRHI